MTKGKILEKHFPTPGNHPDCEAIYDAMDEYAKTTSIAFADWLISEGFYPYEKEVGRWRNINDGILTWSTQELNNQLIEQQTKDK